MWSLNNNFRKEKSLVKGVFGGGSAAEEAGEAQLEGTLAGIEEQRRQFDIAQEQIAPFREAGISALQQQLAFLGLGPTGGVAGGQIVSPDFTSFQSRRADLERQIAEGTSQGLPLPPPTNLGAAMDIAEQRRLQNLLGLSSGTTLTSQAQRAQQQLSALGAAPSQFISGGGADPTGFGSAFRQFAESPGQVFLREQQERALLRGASATGQLGGGNVRTALQQQAFGRGATQLSEFQNRLAALSGSGQTATQNLAQLGGQTAAGIASGLQAGGQAQASGILGAQQARASTAGQILGGIGGILSGGGLIGGLTGLLSDENMKQDIEELDLKACFDAVLSMDLKSWRYIESAGLDDDLHFGPMYQDAPEMIKMNGVNMLSLHDELMMISGAIQYMKNEGLLCLH